MQSHAPKISSKITNLEETKKMVRGRSIGKKARKAPHQAQTPKIVKQIPKNINIFNHKNPLHSFLDLVKFNINLI